jgi:hypothetical protein
MVASYVRGPLRFNADGVGVGGNDDRIVSRSAGASRPAYFQSIPWQALFEQKDVLSVPPGLVVVWQSLQVSLNT